MCNAEPLAGCTDRDKSVDDRVGDSPFSMATVWHKGTLPHAIQLLQDWFRTGQSCLSTLLKHYHSRGLFLVRNNPHARDLLPIIDFLKAAATGG